MWFLHSKPKRLQHWITNAVLCNSNLSKCHLKIKLDMAKVISQIMVCVLSLHRLKFVVLRYQTSVHKWTESEILKCPIFKMMHSINRPCNYVVFCLSGTIWPMDKTMYLTILSPQSIAIYLINELSSFFIFQLILITFIHTNSFTFVHSSFQPWSFVLGEPTACADVVRGFTLKYHSKISFNQLLFLCFETPFSK